MYFRLQDITSVNIASNQPLEAAVDIGEYRTLVVQCRKPSVAMSGTLVLQHSMTLEEGGFVDVSGGSSFNLGSTTTEVNTYTDLLRFVRWRCSAMMMGPAQFVLDVVARKA